MSEKTEKLQKLETTSLENRRTNDLLTLLVRRSEQDTNNLQNIKLLLDEINQKTSIYMRVKMEIEGEDSEGLESRRAHIIEAQQDFDKLDAMFHFLDK